MRPLALAIIPLLVSCWWRSSAPATPVLPEVVHLAPDTASYRLVEHRRMEQTVNGRPLVIEQRWTTWLGSALAGADSGLAARWTLDSIAVAGAVMGGLGATARDAAGTVFHAALGGGGPPTAIEADRASDGLIAHVADLLVRFFPVTGGGARPGAASVDTTELVTGWTTRLRGLSVNLRTVGDWTTWAGVPALRISTESRYTLEGAGRLSEHFEVALAGEGRRYAQQYLDGQGRYLGGTAADTADLEARVAGTDLVIPIRQMSVDTVEARR